MTSNKEIFVSVDVETAGPIPGEYSLLSIGACLVDDDSQAFECELQPVNENFVPEALAVTGLSLEHLKAVGLPPPEAMKQFANWIESQVHDGESVVFVGFNAAFDWSFVNYYFNKYLGENPFGIAALDIKSLYMGSTNGSWADTRSSKINAVLMPRLAGGHKALQDAKYQAELFRLIRARLQSR
jgi:DNA polymerase III epsilon subunit-like protein